MNLLKFFQKRCMHTNLIRFSSNFHPTDNNLESSSKFFNEKSIAQRPALTVEEKRKIAELKMQYMREIGEFLPDELTEEQWKIVLEETSESRIVKILRHFSRKYYYRLRDKAKKDEIAKEKRVRVITPDTFEVTNYPGYRSIYGHISSNDALHNARLIAAARLNDPYLVFDFRFEKDDKHEMISSLTNQVQQCYAENRRAIEPFQFTFCNINPNGKYSQMLEKRMPSKRTIIHYTAQSYLDLFPQDKLVYLSPDAKRDMREYDPNKAYVIGVLGDKFGHKIPHSLMQAKKDGIECVRFPIERYVQSFQGAKEFCLDHVVRVLLALKQGESWRNAFRFLPARKINYK